MCRDHAMLQSEIVSWVLGDCLLLTSLCIPEMLRCFKVFTCERHATRHEGQNRNAFSVDLKRACRVRAGVENRLANVVFSNGAEPVLCFVDLPVGNATLVGQYHNFSDDCCF